MNRDYWKINNDQILDDIRMSLMRPSQPKLFTDLIGYMKEKRRLDFNTTDKSNSNWKYF